MKNYLEVPFLMNDSGEYETPVQVAARMQQQGIERLVIDRWLQGLEHYARANGIGR